MTDKLFGHKTDIADVYGFQKYNLDLELLRTNPELSTRRLLTTVTEVIQSVTHYKSYGMIVDVVDTTKPQTAINQYLKDNSTVTDGSYKEYRVHLFDRNPTKFKTVMQNCNDVIRGITLKVCNVSSKLDNAVLQSGMLVLVDYTDSSRNEGTIVEVLGNLPSVVSEDTTEYDAKVPFQNEPCPDTSNVKPNSDSVNSPNSGDIDRLRYTKVIDSGVENGKGYIIVELSDGTKVKKIGTLATRNNNPGNIRVDRAEIGSTTGATGRFAVFATYEDGLAALNKLLFNPNGQYYNKSIAGAINDYAPPKENNTEQYIKFLENKLNKPRTTLIKDLSESERLELTNAIAKIEGYNRAGLTTTVVQGTTSAPTPSFTSPSCKPPQESIEDAAPTDPETEFSKYFKLKDLIVTSKKNLSNIPNDQEKERLGYLARNILDPLVEKYGEGSFSINSAFRSEAVNTSVGGSKNSQHRWGQAVDITFKGLKTEAEIFDRFEEIVNSSIPYDQLILESKATGVVWFHISIAYFDGITPFNKRKKEVLMFGPWNGVGQDKKKKYLSYNRQTANIYGKTSNPKLTELA